MEFILDFKDQDRKESVTIENKRMLTNFASNLKQEYNIIDLDVENKLIVIEDK